jgi:hypothetical protein
MELIMKRVLLALLLLPAMTFAQGQWENLDGHLGALSRENLDMSREAAPVDVTGTWGINMATWPFNPPDTLLPQYQAMVDRAAAARSEGLVYNNDVGLCWPPGMPMMMNRVWPINLIQLPTAVVIISNFMNQVRMVYMDGRSHTDPDIFVPSYNGESIGHWEGKTLVIETKNFGVDHHWITDGVPATATLTMVERITLSDDGNEMAIEYTLTDPNVWEGEWVSTKRYRREERVDFLEVHCLPDLNEGIMATDEKYRVTE